MRANRFYILAFGLYAAAFGLRAINARAERR